MSLHDHLVDDWRDWKRWWSLRWAILSAFCAAAAGAYATLPADWLPSVPGWVKGALAFGAMFSAGASGISRVVKQKPVRPLPTVTVPDPLPTEESPK